MKLLGQRKFIGFVLTLTAYTVVLIIALTKVAGLVVDVSVFAMQASMGYVFIASTFFVSNVAEHFIDKKKVTP